MKYATALCSLMLLFFACSDKPNQQTGVQDFPNTLQASSREAVFDLPSSLQSETPDIQAGATPASLAKFSVTDSIERDPDLIDAFKVYLAVPAYIHLAEEAKLAVQAFILDLSKNELPPHWEGKVDGLDVKTLYTDTTIDGHSGIFCSLEGSRKDTMIIALRFFRNDSNQYRGRFFLHEPANHHSRIRVDFNNIATAGEQRMTVTFRRDSTDLEKTGDPALIRVHAIKRPSGRIVVTGSSYHPTYADDFWGNAPKIYGFQAVSHPEKNRTVMRVAFADADSVGSDFYTYHSVDQGVLRQVTKKMQQNMRDSTDWNKLIYFSLDSGLAAREIFTEAHIPDYLAYEPTRTPDDFTEEDLEQFLDLNRESILGRKDGLGNLRGLYFLVKIQQPIFLANDARVVGTGPDGAPAEFPLPATAITDEGLEGENPAGFQENPVEP